MDISSKQQDLLQKISDADSLLRMREACQEFLSATAPDAASGPEPKRMAGLLQALISGVRCPPDDLDEMIAANLGEDSPKRFLVMSARGPDGNDAALYAQVAEEIAQLPHTWGFVHLDKLVCVTTLDSPDLDSCPAVEVLKRHKFRAGVSRPFFDLSQIAAHYEQARLTLKIACVLQKGAQICPADHFFLFQLLMGLRNDVDIMDFCIEEIQALSRYDRESNSDLCDTLLIYLQNSKNTIVTAKKMNLHRNTVHYRIDRCREISGLDLDDGVIAFMALVSLYILEYKAYQMKVN